MGVGENSSETLSQDDLDLIRAEGEGMSESQDEMTKEELEEILKDEITHGGTPG